MKSDKHASSHDAGKSPDAARRVAPTGIAPARRLGNAGLLRLIQAKLTVSDPADMYEQEADRIADQVMRMPAHDDTPMTPSRVPVQRKCAMCEDELQRSEVSSDHSAPTVDAATEQAITSLSGRGHALPESVRSFMEPRFRADFSAVRIHTDAHAQRLARSVDAQAFTVGRNVVFGAGHYAPESDAGKRLLAHELTHVVQQNGAAPSLQRAPEDAKRWSRSESAARYRGQVMAQRIGNHGKVSKDAEAKIEQELAYFEGAAREVYIREVRPAYIGTGKVHFPSDPLTPVRESDLSSMPRDPRAVDDEAIYAGRDETKQREEAALEAARQAMIARLEKKTADWLPEDREFALDLLRPFLRHTTDIDARAVSDRIRKPILERYEAWLHAQDEYRVKHLCVKLDGLIGVLADANMKLNPGSDNCVSWFARSDSYGPVELMLLGNKLSLNRLHGYNKGVQDVADYIYWDVFEFRKLTDPKLLWQKAVMGGIANKAVTYVVTLSTPGGVPRGSAGRPVLPPRPVAPASVALPAAAVRGGAPPRIQAPMAPAPGAPVASGTRVTSEPPQPRRVIVPSVESKHFVRGFARGAPSAPRPGTAGPNDITAPNPYTEVPTASPTETTHPIPRIETVVGGFRREPSRRLVQPRDAVVVGGFKREPGRTPEPAKEAVVVGGPGRQPGRTSEPAKDAVVVGGPGRQPGRTSEPARDPVSVGGFHREASRPPETPETLPPSDGVPIIISGPDEITGGRTNPVLRPGPKAPTPPEITPPGEAVPEHIDDGPSIAPSDGVPREINDRATNRVPIPAPIAKGHARLQVVGEYRFVGTEEMGSDGVLHRHIGTLEHIGGPTTSSVPFNRFFRALIDSARAAGARVLRITGEFGGNANVGRLNRFLAQFGGSADVEGTTIEIVIPLGPP